MKIFSLRFGLIVAVVLALVANIFWRTRGNATPEGQSSVVAAAKAEEGPPEENIMPSFSNLKSMGAQWQRRLDKMSPEQQKQAAERFKEEVVYFVQAQRLPQEERREAIRGRLEALMNDPAIQREWADERHEMLASLSPEKRHKMFKQYVQYKNQIKPR